MRYQGSCHCGRIGFEVEGTLEGVMSCNCSLCQRKGALLWFVPKAHMKLFTDEADSAFYRFNKHVISHRFCPVCGIHPYAEAVDPHGQPTVAINVRCLQGVELETLPVNHYDGRAR